MTAKEKVMENRLRRKAHRMGFKLLKSRRRDPDAIDFGGYALADLELNCPMFGFSPFGTPWATMDEVRAFLKEQT